MPTHTPTPPQFLENIIASMEEGLIAVDREYRITTFNRAAERITGFKKEEVIQKQCSEVINGEHCREQCLLEKTIQSGESFSNYETTLTTKTGDRIPVDIKTCPLRSPDDDIIGGLELIRDLTKHKGLREKLRQERDRAQLYLSIAGVIILELNTNGHITLINKKGCDLLGYSEDEILGRDWFDLCIPQRHRQEVRQIFRRLIAGEIPRAEYYENPILTRSGEERIIAWRNTLQRDHNGHIVGTLSSGEDVTERKQAQTDLIRSEKLASLGQLAAGVAHEVNNPLAGILVYINLLLKKHRDNRLQTQETEKQLLKIKKEVERSSRIIRNLLDFSRQSEASIRPVDVTKAIDATLYIVGHQISLDNVLIDKNLAESLPLVLADFDQIQQALTNIILNGAQAMPDGGTLTITTSVARDVKIGTSFKECVGIEVADTGVGIPPEHLEKIFTPFFTTKEKGKGIGLGLPVVYGIIERHKGRIDVESDCTGTTFKIYLERIHEDQADDPRC